VSSKIEGSRNPRRVDPAGWVCWQGHGPYANRQEAFACPACEEEEIVRVKDERRAAREQNDD
jgi:Zn finger protein HypA/HybF involved in hydrogenase expression